MPDQKDPSAPMAKVNGDVVAVAMIVCTAMVAFMGVMLPDWAKVPGPMVTWISIALYVGAVAQVGMAFFLRAMIKKAQRSASSGVIQR